MGARQSSNASDGDDEGTSLIPRAVRTEIAENCAAVIDRHPLFLKALPVVIAARRDEFPDMQPQQFVDLLKFDGASFSRIAGMPKSVATATPPSSMHSVFFEMQRDALCEGGISSYGQTAQRNKLSGWLEASYLHANRAGGPGASRRQVALLLKMAMRVAFVREVRHRVLRALYAYHHLQGPTRASPSEVEAVTDQSAKMSDKQLLRTLSTIGSASGAVPSPTMTSPASFRRKSMYNFENIATTTAAEGSDGKGAGDDGSTRPVRRVADVLSPRSPAAPNALRSPKLRTAPPTAKPPLTPKQPHASATQAADASAACTAPAGLAGLLYTTFPQQQEPRASLGAAPHPSRVPSGVSSSGVSDDGCSGAPTKPTASAAVAPGDSCDDTSGWVACEDNDDFLFSEADGMFFHVPSGWFFDPLSGMYSDPDGAWHDEPGAEMGPNISLPKRAVEMREAAAASGGGGGDDYEGWEWWEHDDRYLYNKDEDMFYHVERAAYWDPESGLFCPLGGTDEGSWIAMTDVPPPQRPIATGAA